MTNTTTKSLESFHQKLTNLDLPIDKEEVISAPYAAVLYLKQLGNPKCYLLLEEDAKRDFAQFPQSDNDPDVIVVGDIGDRLLLCQLLLSYPGSVKPVRNSLRHHYPRYWFSVHLLSINND